MDAEFPDEHSDIGRINRRIQLHLQPYDPNNISYVIIHLFEPSTVPSASKLPNGAIKEKSLVYANYMKPNNDDFQPKQTTYP